MSASAATLTVVMLGRDPGIYEPAHRAHHVLVVSWKNRMDCRVKPGNDDGESTAGGKCGLTPS
jgi:hypothetical protein